MTNLNNLLEVKQNVQLSKYKDAEAKLIPQGKVVCYGSQVGRKYLWCYFLSREEVNDQLFYDQLVKYREVENLVSYDKVHLIDRVDELENWISRADFVDVKYICAIYSNGVIHFDESTRSELLVKVWKDRLAAE